MSAVHAGLLDDIRADRPITALRQQLLQTEVVAVHVWDTSGPVLRKRIVRVSDRAWVAEVAGLAAKAEIADESPGQFGVSPPVEFIGPGEQKLVCYPRGRLMPVENAGGPLVLQFSPEAAARFHERLDQVSGQR